MSLLSALFGRPDPGTETKPSPSSEDLFEAQWRVPFRREAVRRAASLLCDLGPEDAALLVHGVARKFFGYVVDLPASERHHHASKFGLVDHSLEVAEFALRASLSRYFTGDTRAYPEDQEYRVPRLRYAAWFLGLFHDAGKVSSVTIRANRETWNPYVEPLEDFYRRHGRDAAGLAWNAGRGLDAHTWHNAYLMGVFLTGRVGAYLGRRLTSHLLAQETEEAKEVLAIVQEADRRSTRESLARPAATLETPAPSGPEVLVGGGEYAGRIPAVLARAVSDGTLRANVPSGHLFVGRKWVLFRYPAGVQALAFLIREACGHQYARARALTASESGARELSSYLHERRALLVDPESDLWKMKARISDGSGYDVTEAILIDRATLEPAVAGLGLFEGRIDVARATDERRVPVEDWKSPVSREAAEPSTPAPVETERPARDTVSVSKPAAPASPAATPPAPRPVPALVPAAAAVASLRKFISGEVLFADIRAAILDGTIPSNQWNKPCFVLEEVTYVASPRGFQCLFDKGLYNRNPKREVNVYLDALAKIPAVRKKASGKVLTGIAVRPGARGLWVVAFDTRGLFKDAQELARVGYWTESPIRELREAEMRAGSPHASPPAAAPPAPEVTHA